MVTDSLVEESREEAAPRVGAFKTREHRVIHWSVMTIVVKSLTGHTYHLPYYGNMPVGKFVTHVVSPAMGYSTEKNGDMRHRFVHTGVLIFTRGNSGKRLSDILQDGGIVFHSLMLGRFDDAVLGNGDPVPPTPFHLQLTCGADACAPSAAKKIKREPSNDGGVQAAAKLKRG